MSILFILMSVVANASLLFLPLIFGKLINTVQLEGATTDNFTELVSIVSLILVITLVFWFLHGPSRIIEQACAFRVRQAYQNYLLEHIMSLKLAWHGDRDSGDTIDKIEKGSTAMFRFSEEIFVFISIFVQFFGTATILLYFNFYAGVAMFSIVFVAFFILHAFDRKLVKQFAELNLYSNAITAKIFDSLSNITSIIILRIKHSVLGDIAKNIDRPFPYFIRNKKLGESKWFIGSIMFDLAIVIPIVLYLYTTIKSGGIVEVGTLSALYLYLQGTGNVFNNFAYHYEQLLQHRTDVANTEIIEVDFAQHIDIYKKPRFIKHSFSITGATFSYHDENQSRHLDNVSLSFERGERIALIGESGSGKTTFLKILHGLYPLATGKVEVDGKKLRKGLHEIDLGTTLVPQEPELFSASIRENITLGVDATEEEVDKVMSLAEFSGIVRDLPQGLESKVNEKGVNLSGGQKQRLALARALFFAKDKSVVLLDESTSSVDPVNEKKIYQNIFNSFADKTILASIHKYNLLDQFDRIIMFDNGQVIADGSLKQLLKTNQKFSESWALYKASVG